MNLKNTRDLDELKPEPAITPRDTSQRIPCFDRCQLIITWMSNIGGTLQTEGACLCHVNMVAILRDFVVVAVVLVVRTRPRAMPLAMITMRKSTHGFLSFLYGYGAPLGGSSGRRSSAKMKLADFNGFQAKLITTDQQNPSTRFVNGGEYAFL